MTALPVRWTTRELPRAPVGVLGSGPVARALAGALLRAGAEASVSAAASYADLLVLGEEDRLPWVDGVVYLGRSDGVLLPTTLDLTVPIDMVRQALRERGVVHEVAILPGRVLSFPVPDGEPDPAWLRRYADGGGS